MSDASIPSLSFRPEGFGPSSAAFRCYRLVANLGGDDRLLALMPAVDRDGLVAFALFGTMLFIGQLGTAGAALFVLIATAYMAARRGDLFRTLRERWYLLPFPLFAIASTLWSTAPGETLKHSGEFAVTVLAAILLASARNPKSVLLGIFAAFAAYVTISVLKGNMVDVGDHGARALGGLNDSKNEEADMAATGFLLSAAVFVIGVRLRSLAQCIAAAFAGAIQIYAVADSLSMGAMAGLGVALVTLTMLIVLRRLGSGIRASVLILGVAAVICAALVVEMTSGSILQWLASAFDKDPTLTGRTYLWFRARDLIAENPLLGQGFAAFWQQGNLDAEGLWRFAQITTRQGFNFHNTLYDALVSVGWIGAIILGFTFLSGLIGLAAAYVRRPTLLACFWLSMAAYLFTRMPAECVGLNEFYFSAVLLFALLGYGKPLVTPTPVRPPLVGPGWKASVPPASGATVLPLPGQATARFWGS